MNEVLTKDKQVDPLTGIVQVPVRKDLLVISSSETTPSDRSIEKRRLRKHYILNVIREKGPLSRAEMAKESGLNLPSVSSLVDELLADELVVEQEARPALRGRRPIPVYLRTEAASVLGIDIGKRSTTALYKDLGGKALASWEAETPQLSTPEEYAAWAIKVANTIFLKAPQPLPPLCGIGVALPGLISTDATVPGLAGKGEEAPAVRHIRHALKSAFNVEVLIENDARITIYGATWFEDNKQESENFVVLSIGFGLGLGVCANGKVIRGVDGFSGEIGHIPLGAPGIPCYCGAIGCLENRASGAALQGMAKERGLKTDDVETLAEMARAGDREARQLFSDFAEALGRGVATIINLFNPEVVIITGRVSKAADLFLDEMKASAKSHTIPLAYERTAFVIKNHDNNMSSLGAAAIVLNQIFFSCQVSFEDVI